MTQQNKTMNFYIQDANGHPQFIKVVQSTPNKGALTSIVGATNTSGIKVFKTPGQDPQVLQPGTQVLRTISLQSQSTPGQRLVTIPLQNTKMTAVKSGDSQGSKTIQLTSAQMSTLKQNVMAHSGGGQQIIKDASGKTFVTPLLDHSTNRKRYDADGHDYVPQKKGDQMVGAADEFTSRVCLNRKRQKEKIERIKTKTQQLHQLILQHISFKNLVERNSCNEKLHGPPKPNSAIQLPFIILNTSKKTVVDCSITNDKSEYLFNFNNKFEIHDDIEVLKRMGLAFGLESGKCVEENLRRAKSMVPKSLEKYVEQMASGDLDKFIPVTIPGPSAPIEDVEIKMEGSGSRPPSSSHTSLSGEASPPSHYFSEDEEEEEEMSEQDDTVDSDVDVN